MAFQRTSAMVLCRRRACGFIIAKETDRADLLNKEVPIFIQQIRGTTSQPPDYGSTKVE